MTTLSTPASTPWTPFELRAWRARLRWTQARAAAALLFHLEAYKKLECGTRTITPRIRRLCILTEREHVRALHTSSGQPGSRQVFATADRVLEHLAALEADGKLVGKDGRRRMAAVSRPPAVVYAADLRHGTVGQKMPTLQVGPRSGWSLNASACAVTDTVLRRLSPLECMRLQGFDDADWLENVRVGGRPLTDTDRYRLIGNSWAVPVAAWLLERLLAFDAEDRR